MTDKSQAKERQEIEFTVQPDEGGERLEKLVSRYSHLSRKEARILIRTGQVRVGRKVVKVMAKPLRAGTRVQVLIREQEPVNKDGKPAVEVLFLDPDIMVVFKPAGLLSESDRVGSPSVDSMASLILARMGEKKRNAKLVHRLDAGTSGILVLARNNHAAKIISAGFAQGRVHKTYLALAKGNFARRQEVNAPIGRLRGSQHGVKDGGKPAATLFSPLSKGEDASLIRAQPRTGRTHQIRVHLAHLGYPILGDRLYGGPGYLEGEPPEAIGRPMLHAYELRFQHP
ncbi:RluA family pseudouridine synthase, partial [Myxococcota bacterium]|nr:RluA family pseudouridine synthase [Myxococcota bacterium]